MDEHRTPEYMRNAGLGNLASFFSDVAKRPKISAPVARECFENCLRWLADTDLDPRKVGLDTILSEVSVNPVNEAYGLAIEDPKSEKTVEGKRQILTAILKRNGDPRASLDIDSIAREAVAPAPAI